MSQPQPFDVSAIVATLRERSRHWIAPTVIFTSLAILYALFVHRPAWEAKLALMIREEAASGVSRDGRPGRFDGLEAMKTAQETVQELASSRAVVAEALKRIGPPSKGGTEDWPSPQDIEDAQSAIKVKPPKGAEFGKTEVFYLLVRNTDRARALALTQAIVDELDARLKLVRDRRAKSLIQELTRAADLVRADRERATQRLTALEQSVGGDLAELRMLTETTGGESNLRSSMTAVKNDLRAAQVAQQNRQQLLEMLRAAELDPTHLLATPNELLVMQPTLQQLKNGLITAQLTTAQLQGTMTDQHPLAQAAAQGEAEIRARIHNEIAAVIRSIEAELKLGEGRIATLEAQLNEIAARMDRLASIRANYANVVSEVRHYDEMLQRAEHDLAAARASLAASHATSLLTRLEEPYTPDHPTGPSKAVIVLAGFAGGLAVGLGWVFLTTPAIAAPRHPVTNLARAEDAVALSRGEMAAGEESASQSAAQAEYQGRLNQHTPHTEGAIRVLSFREALAHLADR